ncbi:acetaldehyde dehydrogenase (acetylating) [Enterococcus sp. DIV0212c]|uniref:acetaldehyde dehydrogenase (acetylating) n=1 Tax=Enterococcus sp. DIV0212c TaxID=2230867 RepID=UPI001A9BBD27|nr:acetaldehyde dehydrogenase (acetylating) [Enterococcus sp. DIV0212c]MBO1354393.1 acetaldehyde dehydrogenase (acetylating) [Enterococcus sp. DIV0212c]
MVLVEIDKDLRSVQEARNIIVRAKKAQLQFKEFSVEKIDSIVEHVAIKAKEHAVELAQMAHEETGFGKVADKVIKNTFASQRVFEYIRDMKILGIIQEDQINKTMDIGIPLGVITALIPSTNPTSTAIYKSLIALKSGNGIVFSPHPNAQKCSKKTLDIIIAAAIEAGAPEGLIGYLDTLTLQGTQEMMKHKDVALILATGGEGMVRAAYNSGTPTISGGPGNGPAFIERSADIKQAVEDIITSKTFDNGVICASEQSIIAEDFIAEEVKRELLKQGAYFMTNEESDLLGNYLLKPNGAINAAVVGQSAQFLAEKAGFSVDNSIKILVSNQKGQPISSVNPYSREKLCPVLAYYTEKDWQNACERCIELLTNEGQGHTLTVHTKNEDVIREFALKKPVYRILVNTPAAIGGIGATTNLAPALTLGCGAIGHGSTSDNVSPWNLVNIRKVGFGVRSLDELRGTGANQENASCPSTKELQETEDIAAILKVLLERVKQ